MVNDETNISSGQLEAYEELRTGFTAVVSHELRTPLARALALIESGEDPAEILTKVRAEIEEMTALVDDVLFLAELESGRAVVAFGPAKALPELERVAAEYADRADRADVRLEVTGDRDAELPLRPRMLAVVAENLIQNALRYAGPGTTLTLAVRARRRRRRSSPPTTVPGSTRVISLVSSSASSAATVRAPRAGPGSASRS